LKYISVAFANDKVTPKNHSYKNIDATHYINCSDGNPYTTQPGGKGVVNPSAHLNSKGYVRHSGFQNTVVDSASTEATLLSNGQGKIAMVKLTRGFFLTGILSNPQKTAQCCPTTQISRSGDQTT
jgi:hypothetical protein